MKHRSATKNWSRSLRTLVSCFVVSGLAGCANVQVSPPVERSIERSRVYDATYDKIWARAVDWFADHNVSIDKIEKESGLVTARFKIRVDQNYLDCGGIEVSGVTFRGGIERLGTLNLTVRETPEHRTKVSVNFFGEWSLEGRDQWDGRPVSAEGRCVSTGELERSVLAFIGG